MTQTVAAELQSVFTAKGVAALLGDYQKVDRATNQTQTLLTAFGKTTQRVWQTGATDASRLTTALGGVRSDLSRLNTEFTNVGKSGDRAVRLVLGSVKDLNTRLDTTHTSKNRFFTTLTTQAGTAQRDIKGMIGQVETLGSKLAGLRLPSFGGFSLPGFGGGGGGILGGGLSSGFGIPGLGLLTAPLGAAAGLVGNVAGGALSLGGQAAGFGLGQLGAGISSIASIGAGRSSIAAHMGTGFTKLPAARQQAILDQITDNAFLLSSAPETGKVNSVEALAAMDEAAKAGITDPTAMLNIAKTALQLRSAGGEDKITTSNAMRLLITGKNVFGGKYSDLQVANGVNGLINATTLDIGQIQGILKNAGAANTTGMGLNQYLLEAGMFAQAGVNPGQIGGGISQVLRMSQPSSAPSKEAAAALGLTVGGKNQLWDAQGNIKDPAAFFAQILKGTQGMTPEQTTPLLGKAFNPKAAGYIEQVLGYYKDNPQAWTDLSKQIASQSDVAATAATQNDNLETSLTNLGDTVSNVRDKLLMGLTPALKGVVDWGTSLGQDVLGALMGNNDWGKLGDDFFGFFNRFGGIGDKMRAAWDKDIGPVVTKIFDAGKQLVDDALTGNWSQLGADFQTDLNNIFGPGTSSAVQANLAQLGNFFDTDVKPIFFGTDDERSKAISNLLGGVGGSIGGWLGKDLPGLISQNAPIVAQIAAQLGGTLANSIIFGAGKDFESFDWGKWLNDTLGNNILSYFGDLGGKAGEAFREKLGLDKNGVPGSGPNSDATQFNKNPANYTANPLDPASWNPLDAAIKAVEGARAALDPNYHPKSYDTTTVPGQPLPGGTLPGVPHKALGGPAFGRTLVGEKGAEVVDFALPAWVYPHGQKPPEFSAARQQHEGGANPTSYRERDDSYLPAGASSSVTMVYDAQGNPVGYRGHGAPPPPTARAARLAAVRAAVAGHLPQARSADYLPAGVAAGSAVMDARGNLLGRRGVGQSIPLNIGPFQIIIQVPAGMASDPQGWHQTGILVGRGIAETLDKVSAIRNATS